MKACPFCAEEIQDAAVKCRFCGEMLPSSPAPIFVVRQGKVVDVVDHR
jgi:ribosomal protein L24E